MDRIDRPVIAGRSVLVAAATPGTGRAPAPGLTSPGAQLAIVRQDRARTHQVAGEVSAAGGGSVEAFVADLQARLGCGIGSRPQAGVAALRRPTVRSRGLPTAATTRPSPLDSGRRARTSWARPRHPVPDIDGPASPLSSVPGVDGFPAPAADPTRQRWAARNRVLIVDDHAPFRSIAGQLLTADGFVVLGEAADGAAAIRVCDELHPDIVVLDVQLPDLDGFAVAALLTTRAAAPVVVLVSSRSRTDYGSRIVECGARAYLAKAELSGRELRRLLSPAQPPPPKP